MRYLFVSALMFALTACGSSPQVASAPTTRPDLVSNVCGYNDQAGFDHDCTEAQWDAQYPPSVQVLCGDTLVFHQEEVIKLDLANNTAALVQDGTYTNNGCSYTILDGAISDSNAPGW